ncbi:tight junction protein, partial [Danaus plexippus plexippus]
MSSHMRPSRVHTGHHSLRAKYNITFQI